jgi:hypothetical protein
MDCWNKKCGYKGKPEWGTFQLDAKYKWIKSHIRCPKCKGTNVCMKGLEGLEYEIRYPSRCSGVKGETKAHPTVRKVINIHSTGYSIGCPICGWGMATGGGELNKKEIERLKKMYAESLSIKDATEVFKITCSKHEKIAIFCEDCMREKIEVVESRKKNG